MKVIIGAGGSSQPGWISFNQEDLDIRKAGEWARHFSTESIDCILAEHVWEHLTKDEGFIAAVNCWIYLKPGGDARKGKLSMHIERILRRGRGASR